MSSSNEHNYVGCVAKINNSALLYTGGDGSPDTTYLYDVDNDAWTQMNDVSDSRLNHGCGSFDAQAGLKSKESECTSLIVSFIS